jgi:hypothetical protein
MPEVQPPNQPPSVEASGYAARSVVVANGMGIGVSILVAITALIWLASSEMGGSPLSLLILAVASAVAYRLTFSLVIHFRSRRVALRDSSLR